MSARMRVGARRLGWAAAVLAAMASSAAAGSARAQSFVVSGRMQYVDKAWGWTGWTGAQPLKPIRRADITVLDNQSGAVLGQGTTQSDGTFSILCTSLGVADVVVRCDADTSLSGGQRVRVLTEGNVEYSSFGPVFAAHLPGVPLDAGTVNVQPVPAGSGKPGNPFNLLDMGLAASDAITGPEVGAAPSPQTMRLFWPGSGGSFTAGTAVHISDDDGYDDSVVLHELGHCVHNMYSSNDSPGGSHTFGFSDQDPRLAFSEGYATFFAGLVLRSLGLEAMYVDADGGTSLPGSVNLRLRLETVAPWAAEDFGEADEVAVACTLYDMLDDETWLDETPGLEDDSLGLGTQVLGLTPAKAWWNLFVGPIQAATNLSMPDAWDGWFSLYAADSHLPQMMQAWESRRIRFWSDDQEPDNAPAAAKPLAAGSSSQWSPERTLYFSPAVPPAPGTGDVDHYAVALVKGDVVSFQTRYPAGAADADTGCDPLLEISNPSGLLVASADGGGTGRNALVAGLVVDATGTWTCAVRTASALRRYGRYEVQCSYVSQNHPPQITSGPTATPATITSSQTAGLTVTATDSDAGQTLSYAWSTIGGGAILGTGSAVTFVPPAVAVDTPVGVQVVVSDNLGAESEVGATTVTVKPGAGAVCAQPAAASTGGVGKPGQVGVPLLVPQNLPAVPSSNFALHLSNALPGLPGFLVFGYSLLNVPFDGGTLYPTPNIVLGVTPGVAGSVHFPIVLPADPVLCGFTLYAQVLLPHDPGAAGFRKTAQSNFVSFTFGG